MKGAAHTEAEAPAWRKHVVHAIAEDRGWWDLVGRDPIEDLLAAQEIGRSLPGGGVLFAEPEQSPEDSLVEALLRRIHPELHVEDSTTAQPGDKLKRHPHQEIPWDDPTWEVYLLRGGRGSGKTITGALAVMDHVREWGPKLGRDCRVGIGAPTRGDARDVCAEGPTGLISLFPDEFDWNRSLLEARHKASGAFVKFLGSEEPSRWNGPQWSLLWCDELALWRESSWEQAQFGVRLGPRPLIIATTTPKSSELVWKLGAEAGTRLREVTTYDNPSLPKSAVARWERMFEGTDLYLQEMLAQRISQAAGALWQRVWIEGNRVRRIELLPHDFELLRCTVNIDPSVTAGPKSDECGISVTGLGNDEDGYVLADLSGRMRTGTWARRAVDAYHDWQADGIVAEVNNGGDLVEDAIHGIDANVPVYQVRASRGKAIRAQPIASLYQQGRVHHVGIFPKLEDQMCTWQVPDDRAETKRQPSPDRMESVVWGLAENMLGGYESWNPRDWKTHRR